MVRMLDRVSPVALGSRPEYTATCRAAFLYDPDGHKIRAVCYAED